MKTKILTFAFIVAGSTLALAQGSGTGGTAGGTSGTAAAPGGVSGSAPSGGAGVPGGTGPGNTTVQPNITPMNPTRPTVGSGPGGSMPQSGSSSGLYSSPSSLNTPGAPNATTNPSDPSTSPSGTPQIMVPERR